MRDREQVTFQMNPGCAVSEKMYIVGPYDFDSMSFLEKYVSPGDTFYDIGANIGPFSLLLGSNGANVFAFEGHPKTTERLKHNFCINNLPDQQAMNLAVSDSSGVVSFIDNTGSSINKIAKDGDQSIEVECTSIDDFTKNHPEPRFVKIDTEGHELKVILGMKKMLEKNVVDFVSFEANGLSPESDLSTIYDLLQSHSFSIGLIDYKNRKFTYLNNLGKKSPTGDYQALSSRLVDKIRSEGFSVEPESL